MHIAIFFAAAISSGGLDGFTVDDVKIGLLDTRTKAVIPHTESIKYRTNGKCIVAGNQRDCMWWGLSFDYRGLTVGEDVLCSIQTSQGVHKSDIYKKPTRLKRCQRGYALNRRGENMSANTIWKGSLATPA